MSTVAAFPPFPGAFAIRTLLVSAAITWFADFLFWPAPPGLSLGIFAVMLGIARLALFPQRPRSARIWIAFAVLLASSAQCAIEYGPSNLFVLTSALIWMSAETLYDELPHWPARISESILSLARAPGRWWWVHRTFVAQGLGAPLGSSIAISSRGLQTIAPAAALAGVFLLLLSRGNAILAFWISQAFTATWNWLSSFDLTFSRLFFWTLAGTFALSYFRPSGNVIVPWASVPQIPAWRRADRRFAFWQSAAILVTLNALFFVVNTIDAVYLWQRGSPPAGVTSSEYVHRGVFDLITAVLLSALVLSILFLQESAISGRRLLKILAQLWIVQNVVLIAGVFLRLKMYVDAYEMSVLRVYVGCFLALVVTGFLLLAIYVERGKGFGWLLRGNALATFALFFLLQFTDVPGWVAQYNVHQAERSPGRPFDAEYLADLGPSAWPALIEAGDHGQTPGPGLMARAVVDRLSSENTAWNPEGENWRSIQLRRDRILRTMNAAIARWSHEPQ